MIQTQIKAMFESDYADIVAVNAEKSFSWDEEKQQYDDKRVQQMFLLWQEGYNAGRISLFQVVKYASSVVETLQTLETDAKNLHYALQDEVD